MLQKLRYHKLFAKMAKCSFWQRNIGFMGHIVSEAGVVVDPKKITTVTDWPRPKNSTEVHSFLGLARFYRKFVEGFASMTKPLMQLMCKKENFEWSVACERSFKGTLDSDTCIGITKG